MPHPALAIFGKNLRLARAAASLDQQDLAARIGKTRSSVANMEAGRQNPGLVEMVSLAEVLDVSVGVLVGEVENPALEAIAGRVAEYERLEAEAKRLALEAAEAKRRIRGIAP